MSVNEMQTHFRYCGREFSGEEVEIIREIIASDPHLSRVAISRLVCERLNWFKPDGGLKEMSCRVALLRMQNDGLILLPPPQNTNGNGKVRPCITSASAPGEPVMVCAGHLGGLSIKRVSVFKESSLFNELMERYHYLGYKPLSGAQMRYLVYSGDILLAALGFGASAWKVGPRDIFIGWNHQQRERNLQLIVNNARFLILPWVKSKNLASMLLAKVATQLPTDWEQRYGYKPVLLETFVEKGRFRGTCYKAANWIYVGETKGRGKKDRYNLYALPVKDIFLYPLVKDFRQKLCGQQ